MTDYVALLAQKNSPAEMNSDAARVSQLLDTYGDWIDKYRGGMPAEWMGVIMLWESNGNAAQVGDASLGEYGLYQIASYVPPLFGLDADARLDPESNVAIASLEYAMEHILWYLRYPSLVELGSKDAWKLARLAFAVGRSGAYQLADLAQPADSGHVMDAIKAYVLKSGGVQLGSQTPDKVWFRVLNIDTQWAIAEQSAGGPIVPGKPQLLPNPLPTGEYTLPANIAPYFVASASFLWLAVAVALGFGMYYMWRK